MPRSLDPEYTDRPGSVSVSLPLTPPQEGITINCVHNSRSVVPYLTKKSKLITLCKGTIAHVTLQQAIAMKMIQSIGLGWPAYIAERLAQALWARQILHSH